MIPEELVAPAAELNQSFGLDTWVYRGADWYVPDPAGAHVARESATVRSEPKVMTSLHGLTSDVAKLVGVSDDLLEILGALGDAAWRDAYVLNDRAVPSERICPTMPRSLSRARQ